MRERELALVAAVKVHALQDGNITRHPETHFLDFVVDGRSVRQMIDGADGLVTELCRPWLHVVPDAVDRLLGRHGTDGLAENRVALLVCGVCGDLECGAVTAQLDVSQDLVSWSEFRWEGGVGEVISIDLQHGFDGRIVFGRAGYEATLRSALERVKTMPYDELEHRGRSFLWPWQWGWRMPPLPPAVSRAIERAVADRESGPTLRTRNGTRMDRHCATRRLHRLAQVAACTLRGCTHTCCGTPS